VVIFEPPQRDPEHAGRGRIEPLRVVQSNHHRRVRSQHPQRIEHPQPDRVCVGALLAWLRQQQRDGERAPPWSSQRR
jgi:hypothetical protein